MKVEKISIENKEDFIEFCFKHRNKLDDSFLNDEDMEKFNPDEENPTFIVRKDGNVIAAASLILNEYYRSGRSGRFRIFYSEDEDLSTYSILLSEIVKCVKEIDKIFLFIPLTNSKLLDVIKSLNFVADRYVYILVKEITESQTIDLPEGYSIREFQFDRDEEDWCHIRNIAFSNLKGNSTPITSEMVHKMLDSPEYLKGGMLFLMHNDTPVGIVRGVNEDYEGKSSMDIGPLAILPDYQGKGLGKQLLRAILNFAQKEKYKNAMLCVNGDNEGAKELYIREGFVQTEGVAAYEYPII